MMWNNTAEVETIQLYTLEEAREIIHTEQQEMKERRNIERRFFIKQRLSGLCLMALGFMPLVLFGNGTLLLFTIPVGGYLTFAKSKPMDFKEKFM